MKTVLVVDDEKHFLASIKDNINAFTDEFSVVTAENGAKAIAQLSSAQIDLVLTDLMMPVLDGLELLAHMSRHYPKVPTMVMTAFVSAEIKKQLDAAGVSQFVEKPVSIRELAGRISNELKFNQTGLIHTVTLPSFAELIEMERKTCTLTVRSKDQFGYLYFRRGVLIEAETGTLSGKEAALRILDWKHTELEIERRCAKNVDAVRATLGSLLADCGPRGQREQPAVPGPAAATEKQNAYTGEMRNEAGEAATTRPQLQKEKIMALEQHLHGLKEIKGFKAAGIMNFTGEMLASESADPNIDLALVGATFNDIFRSAHEASRKIGLDSCKETVINTPKGVVVMRCSGVDEKVHFHVISIIAQDGNQALMKLQVEKMMPSVLQELS